MEAIIMPQIGQDIETGIITEWKKNVGDRVNKGEIVAIVESDKASFEIEAESEGILIDILVEEGSEGLVLEPIGHIGAPNDKANESLKQIDNKSPEMKEMSLETSSKESEQSTLSKNQTPKETTPDKEHKKIFSSPLARKLARELNVDINSIKGTGPNGRIVKKDILSASERSYISDETPVPSEESNVIKGKTIKFSRIQQITAQRLTESKNTIPHFYIFQEIDFEDALVWRELYNKMKNQKITITDMFVHAVSKTLENFPKLNSHVFNAEMHINNDINIGVAVATDQGLLVPVIANANTKDINSISSEIKKVAADSKAGKINLDNKGTFTISSLGMYGIDGFLPIINPPEAAILGIGSAVEKPIVKDGMLGVHRTIKITLSCDHRAINGTDAALFIKNLINSIKNRYVAVQ